MKSIRSEIIILLLSLVKIGFCDGGLRYRLPGKRSYQLPQVAVVNDPQSLQYYAPGPVYAIPTVLIPSQLSLSGSPLANVVIPPTTDPKPVQEFQETSTPMYSKPSKMPAHYYKPKHRHQAFVQTNKRPTSYVNSVYGVPVRMKPLSSVPKTKVTSLSIQPSVDLSGQFNQEAASDIYPSTVGPPVSTYGPPKTVDFQHKTRLGGQSVYHKLKGPSHRHTFYPSKKMRVYSHVHKDHIHNHYIPANHPFPIYKTQQSIKYSAPAYLPPTPSTPPSYAQETTPTYPYPSNPHVRFPENQENESKEQPEPQKPNYGGVTQAIIKNPGVINNYDANIPLHVPSKKPYQFEVNEILKNSELHFVQEAPTHSNNNNEQVAPQNNGLHPQKVPFLYPTQQLYAPIPLDQSSMIGAHNPLDIYALPGVNAYQNNHIVADQDLGTSETVKVPVAVIRGAHNIAGQGMFGFTVKRQDSAGSPGEEVKKPFTPSKRTSDWIPMSGKGVPIVTSEVSEGNLETMSDDFYKPEKKEVKVGRQPVGDIISGKIPEEFSPKEADIVNGKIGFVRSSGKEKRKGSVIDVYPSSTSSEVGGETSDLVVSSVIKFS